MSDVSLSADGERALAAAEDASARANVAIVSAEHLLGGALLVLNELGALSSPGTGQIEAAMRTSQGMGSEAPAEKVMFGSAARAAMGFTAAVVRQQGGGEIDARVLAIGTIASDEVSPAFFESLGMTKHDLLVALQAFSN